MNSKFKLFESQDYLILDDFLSENDLNSLIEIFQSKTDHLRTAKVGEKGNFVHQGEIRSDLIYWLEPHDAPFFFDHLKKIQEELNRTFFLGLKELEAHLALYEPGTFYKKHIDVHEKGSTRKMTYIFYLNKDWNVGDGGELILHLDSPQKIQPIANRLVLFLSDKIPHEVLATSKKRLSITGWFHG